MGSLPNVWGGLPQTARCPRSPEGRGPDREAQGAGGGGRARLSPPVMARPFPLNHPAPGTHRPAGKTAELKRSEDRPARRRLGPRPGSGWSPAPRGSGPGPCPPASPGDKLVQGEGTIPQATQGRPPSCLSRSPPPPSTSKYDPSGPWSRCWTHCPMTSAGSCPVLPGPSRPRLATILPRPPGGQPASAIPHPTHSPASADSERAPRWPGLASFLTRDPSALLRVCAHTQEHAPPRHSPAANA